MKKLSLRFRLILSFLCVAAAVWLAAGIASWYESRDELDEFFDTYQLLLARQLSTADWASLDSDAQKKSNHIIKNLGDDGEEEDEALGFAVFDEDGQMIFNDDEHGAHFSYNTNADGFINQPVGPKKKIWRIIWMKSADGKFTIAVGQEMEYRQEAALEVAAMTLIPWLIGLTFLMLATIWLVSKELRPLKSITKELSQRKPDDLSALITNNPPKEIQPLLRAINQLFGRIEYMIKKERSFISDSAHEMRSPLTALKVQLEVAMLFGDDPDVRKETLNKLNIGVERASRLVEQLLTLSRLESTSNLESLSETKLDWREIIQNAINEQIPAAENKKIRIIFEGDKTALCSRGRVLLCSLLLRNLLDNAIKYSPENAEIKISLEDGKLTVFNSGAKVEDKYLKRLGERFFRPPGQTESGSGLGLSIVDRIARLHNCKTELENTETGFKVTISRI